MKKYTIIVWLAALVAAGCAHDTSQARQPPPYRAYRSANFDWPSVRRVLLMPLANESEFPQATEEIARELTASLQSCGAFEVVLAPPDLRTPKCEELRRDGKYDEVELIEIAHKFQVDAVLLGTVTQYRPYGPPHLGLSVQLVSIAEDIAVASVDGLWDARDLTTADQAREFFRQTSSTNHSLLGHDLVLASPHLFQRFVCHQVAELFSGRIR